MYYFLAYFVFSIVCLIEFSHHDIPEIFLKMALNNK